MCNIAGDPFAVLLPKIVGLFGDRKRGRETEPKHSNNLDNWDNWDNRDNWDNKGGNANNNHIIENNKGQKKRGTETKRARNRFI